MENKELHIENLSDLLKVLKVIKTNDQKVLLVNFLKQTQTNDGALEGVLLFLEDNDWDIDQLDYILLKFKSSPKKINKKYKVSKWEFNKLKYAGILIIFFGLISFYYFMQINNSIDRFYIEEPGLPNYMSDIKTNKWTDVMNSFKGGNYGTALKLLNANSIEGNNDTLIFYKAISYYKLENYEESLFFFKKHLKNSESSFYYDTEFRIGFTWYKLGKTKLAKQQFIKISKNKNHPYSKEAILVLKNIF